MADKELTLEEIKKLPPKERIEKLKEFEKKQKSILEKEKEEAETILKKSLEDIAKKTEEEEVKDKEDKDSKDKKEESLEEIADKAPKKPADEQQQYIVEQQYSLSKQPTTELYQKANELRDSFTQRGYLTNDQQHEAENIYNAFKNKEESGYKANKRSKEFMDAAQKVLHDMMNPMDKYK